MKKKLLRIFSSVLCLCMLTTACGGGTEDAGNGDDGGEAKDTLTIAVQADMADKDPINGSSTNDTLKIKANVYETLIERTVPEGEYKPLLAESWEFNDDATELTMTLREGVMCHNGEPLTAEDCLFSLRCLRESSNTSVTDHMDLENSMKTKVGLLSGGQRQVVTLLMCTLVMPKLLLLDEHTAALDPATADKVMEITRSIVSENHLTTLMITHNLSQALTTGNRTIMLDEGRIILDLGGEERAKMGVNDLLDCYAEKKKKAFDNDRMMLA